MTQESRLTGEERGGGRPEELLEGGEDAVPVRRVALGAEHLNFKKKKKGRRKGGLMYVCVCTCVLWLLVQHFFYFIDHLLRTAR